MIFGRKNVRLGGVGAKASVRARLLKNVRHEDAPRRGSSRNGAAGIRSNAEGGIPRREKQKKKKRQEKRLQYGLRASHRIASRRSARNTRDTNFNATRWASSHAVTFEDATTGIEAKATRVRERPKSSALVQCCNNSEAVILVRVGFAEK